MPSTVTSRERRGRCWSGKENRETTPWVVEIAWDPEHVWVSLLRSRKLTVQHPGRQRRRVLKQMGLDVVMEFPI